MTQPPTSGPAPDPYGQPQAPAQNPYGQPGPGPQQPMYGQQPQQGTPQQDAPQQGAPQQDAPQQGAPQQGAPQGYPPASDQYGQQQPGPAGPLGTVALTIQGSAMTSNMLTPTAKINGHQIQTRYGRQDIPVPAGPIHIELYAQWLRTYGQAAIDFTVEPGQTVPVFYAAPMHQFTTGTIGHEPQKRKGMGSFITILCVVVVFIVLLILLPVLFS